MWRVFIIADRMQPDTGTITFSSDASLFYVARDIQREVADLAHRLADVGKSADMIVITIKKVED